MTDILKSIINDLPKGVISDATFEGANIVIYTENKNFFLEGERQIKEIVDKIKKRIELRADSKILTSAEEAEKIIREVVPAEASLTSIIFDSQRSIVVIEAKKPGLVIGKQGSLLQEVKRKTLWIPQVQRSPAIQSKITENIREVLYLNNNYRRRFLNSIGQKIYKEWSPEKVNEWVRLTFLGGARQVGRSCFLLQTPVSKILIDCGIDVAASNSEKFPYFDIPEFDINELDAVIISHAHLDHSGLLPYIYKMGYTGPCYMSVDYKEPILIKEEGVIKKIKIGEFIDNIIDNSNNLEKLPFYDYAASDVNSNVEAVAFSNVDYKLNFRRIKKVIRHKICDGDSLYKINVKTGRSISVTGSHSVFIMKDGEVKEAKVSEIKEGDYLVVPHKLPTCKIDNVDLSEFMPEFKTDERYIYLKQRYKIPRYLTLSKELMRILGYFTAEGDLDKRSVRFTFNLKEIAYVQQLESDFQKVFGIKPKISLNEGNVLRVKVHSKLLRELFSRFFFNDYKNALSKRVPAVVFNVNNELKLNFLRAYFNGDGTVNYHNWTAVAMSVSKELVSDLTYVCSQIGLNYHTHEGYMGKSSKTKNKVYQLIINLRDFFESQKICRSSSNLIPLKEIQFNEEWYYHRLKTKMHVTKERLISLLNSNLIKYNNSFQIKQTLSKLANSDLAFLPVTKIEKVEPTNWHVYDISVDGDQNFVAGETPICLHNTRATRDIASLLALDFIGVAYKKAASPLFSSTDIKEMVKHSICLEYNEVTDITPDVRLTFYNAGHALGSSMIHLNIGNGLHNFLYAGDLKFGRTRLLDPASTNFMRLETVMIESTYGGKENVMPQRQDAEAELINTVKKVVEEGGKVLIPELGLGRAQETMLIIDDAIKQGLLPKIPIYIDGMIWDINAIHTAYPESLSGNVRNLIFQDQNPFMSETFNRVGSSAERKKVIEGGPCVVLATSGMLVGGASVEYFREFAGNKRNALVFVCYQGVGSLGRQVQDGVKEVRMINDGREEEVKINLQVHTIEGLSAHSGRNQLLAFINKCNPKPKKIIVVHGEPSKILDLASTLYKLNRIETVAPRNLETLRLR